MTQIRRRKSGSYAVGRARRESILDIATAHFFQAGYHRTSMAQIAADVGLSEPGLLHHFPTKKHLLVAVAGRRFDITAAWARELRESDDPLAPLTLLVKITERFLTQPGMIELFVLVSAEAADPSSPAHDLYVEHYRSVVESIAQGFEDAVARGALRPGIDYRAIAQETVAMTDGLQLQWVLFEGQFDLVGRLEDYVSQLSRTLLISHDCPDASDSGPAVN
ncbi:TetR/AcrR family transcriptional regulator [Nocardia vaccinii]|uniref:TetR/AcrR family transcriptional regulator n=1 Tax=Nocardia vaccinii TaxID=1822 RepID=UPI00082CA224|nr:TetR/AcrR family transcriptional regulator [Nocardia vaccinii]